MIGQLVSPIVHIVIDSCHIHVIDRYRHMLSNSDRCNMIGPLVFHVVCIVIDSRYGHVPDKSIYMSPSMGIRLDPDTAPPVDHLLHTQCCILTVCSFCSHLNKKNKGHPWLFVEFMHKRCGTGSIDRVPTSLLRSKWHWNKPRSLLHWNMTIDFE